MHRNRNAKIPAKNRVLQLPNGMPFYHVHQYETEFTYKEIFEDKVYFKHGISLDVGACIFDIGANLGMFTMFVKRVCPSARVFAFEPSPEICGLLRLNVAGYGSSVQVHECGMSDQEKRTTFTYYPNYTIMSGFYTDVDEDTQTLAAGIRNQLRESLSSGNMNQAVASLVGDKLKGAQQTECRLRTVSAVLAETDVEKIDLLKIDAEKSELDILRGIDENDWPRIEQIVLEAHSKEQLEADVSLLERRGFEVNAAQQDQFVASNTTNIYARR